jgi:hypothetical protein
MSRQLKMTPRRVKLFGTVLNLTGVSKQINYIVRKQLCGHRRFFLSVFEFLLEQRTYDICRYDIR